MEASSSVYDLGHGASHGHAQLQPPYTSYSPAMHSMMAPPPFQQQLSTSSPASSPSSTSFLPITLGRPPSLEHQHRDTSSFTHRGRRNSSVSGQGVGIGGFTAHTDKGHFSNGGAFQAHPAYSHRQYHYDVGGEGAASAPKFSSVQHSSAPSPTHGNKFAASRGSTGNSHINGNSISVVEHKQHRLSSSSAASGPTPLRRGQACQACRRRKLKCDAVRPTCSTCDKSRKAAAAANHASPVPDGDCVYDDVPAQAPSAGEQFPTSPDESSVSPSSAARDDNTSSSSHKRQKTQTADTSGSTPNSIEAPRKRISSAGLDAGRRVHAKREESAEQRANRLEARVQELEEHLRHGSDSLADMRQRWESGSVTPWRYHSRAPSREPDASDSRPAIPIISMLSPLSGRQERHRIQYLQRPSQATHRPDTIQSTAAAERRPQVNAGLPHDRVAASDAGQQGDGTGFLPQDTSIFGSNGATDLGYQLSAENASFVVTDETLMQLICPGWSSDLPSAETVTSLCEIFFRLHPLRNTVYKPSFMSGLLLPPRHPHRPDDSLIHAILAAAANISPYYEGEDSHGVRDKFLSLVSDPFSRPNTQQAQPSDMLTFKEYHLSKSRLKVERSLLTDFKNPLDWLSATAICLYVLWHDARFVESYFLSGFLCRAVAPAGLDKLPSRHLTPGCKTRPAPGIFGTPQGIEEHERRALLWHCFIADQYTSGPPSFYENMLHEAAIQTNLPCRTADLAAGNDVAPNSQTLSSPDLFRTGHLDDFTLHIKSAVLLRRASTIGSRNSTSKGSGLGVLDKHIDEFLESFPSVSPAQASSDALNASSNISLALIYLHEPFLASTSLCSIRVDKPENAPPPPASNERVMLAVKRVLEIVHALLNSSFDFALLHPQMFLTWSVAARMLGRDMLALQQRISSNAMGEGSVHNGHAVNGDANWKGNSDRRGSSKLPRLAADEHAVLAVVHESLDVIVQALKRGGIKCTKARRCSELVGAVRSGNLREIYLAHLLYLDGVIPTGDEDGRGDNHSATGTSSSLTRVYQPPLHTDTGTTAHDVWMSLASDVNSRHGDALFGNAVHPYDSSNNSMGLSDYLQPSAAGPAPGDATQVQHDAGGDASGATAAALISENLLPYDAFA